jgi:hypothetical protein
LRCARAEKGRTVVSRVTDALFEHTDSCWRCATMDRAVMCGTGVRLLKVAVAKLVGQIAPLPPAPEKA